MVRGGIFLGLDLGGTKIAAIVMNEEGDLLGQGHLPTPKGKEPAEIVAAMTLAAVAAAKAAGVGLGQAVATGVGAPGPLDLERGMLVEAPNLPILSGFPLRQSLAEQLGLPVFLDNDAAVATLGEHRLGAGRGHQNIIYITVSTGVGGGLIIGGEIYRGRGNAGEIGHLTVLPDGPLCPCGRRGCLEALASGPAMARYAEMAIGTGRSSSLRSVEGHLTGEAVGRGAQAGDSLAREVVERASMFLGIALGGLVNLLDPEIILLGGGVSKLGELFLKPAREEMERRVLGGRTCPVKLAGLGQLAGAMGAGVLAREASRENAS